MKKYLRLLYTFFHRKTLNNYDAPKILKNTYSPENYPSNGTKYSTFRCILFLKIGIRCNFAFFGIWL